MEHLSNDHKDHPSKDKNSQNLCNETRHNVFSLTESQWKLRQQHDQNFQRRENYYKTISSVKRKNPIEQDCESHSQGSK